MKKTITAIGLVCALALLPGCTKKLEEEVASLKQLQERLQADLSKITQSRDSAIAEIAKLKPEVESLHSQLADVTGQKAAASTQLANVSAENQALRTRIAELEELIKKSLPPPSYELAGEVFIATRGGSSFKLGAVEVCVLPRADADAWILERRKAAAEMLRKIAPLEKTANEELEVADKAAKQAKEREEQAFNAHLKALLDKKLAAAYQAASAENTRLQKEYYEKLEAAGKLTRARDALLSGDFYFDAFPKPVDVVRTNADGRFKVTLKRDSEWVLAARAKRAIGSSTERYFWVIPVAPPQGSTGEIALNNGNLTSVDNGSLIRTFD